MRAASLILALAMLVRLPEASAQILVFPRTAGKSHVVYFDFQWRHEDLSVSPTPERAALFTGAKSGTVRLFFYEREREVAQRASATVMQSFRYLEDEFQFVPPQTVPLILYSSYHEFLETNLFPLQEGTLGVTSPSNLTMTLPYFGDDRLFERVHTHEMAHQFTIQKLRVVTKKQDRYGESIDTLPLWFIEGLAEFYALRGIDPEAEMLIRDLVANPDVSRDFGLHDFFDEYPYSVLWIYKGGNVRCAFLEDVYGKGTIQHILEASPRLLRGKDEVRLKGFKGLVKYVTGDSAETVSEKFEQWIKRRAYQSYLRSEPDTAASVLEHFDQEVESLRASPDGKLLLMRGFDPETGVSQLMLLDWRAPQHALTVAKDGVPGLESLHPLSGRNFDLNGNSIVLVGESGGRDVIFWQTYTHHATQVGFPEMQMYEFDRRPNPLDPRLSRGLEAWDVKISLGNRRSFPLANVGLIAAFSPSLSPDGKRIAFIGLNEKGTRDVYVLTPGGPAGFSLVQVTHDEYAERELSWGPNGIVYTSDATAHGKYNLFQVSPEGTSPPQRLTTENRDEFDLQVLPDGRVVFVAYGEAHANVYQVAGDALIQRSAVSTGMFMPSTGHDDGLWVLLHKGGRRHPAFLSQAKLLSEPVALETATGPPPQPLAQVELNRDVPYRYTSPSQWELNPIYALAGGGTGGIYAQGSASATDRLRNHALFISFSIYGNFNFFNAQLLYFDQGQRVIWGGGPFSTVRFKYDLTYQDLGFAFTSYERFYGVLGVIRYPFSRFTYFQTDLALGASTAFLDPALAQTLLDPEVNGVGDLLTPWEARYGGTYFQTELDATFGYDSLRYAYGFTPIAGSSLVFTAGVTVQPFRPAASDRLRIDAAHYFHLIGAAAFLVRGAIGASYGGVLERDWYLSSFDTLRGVPYGNYPFLLGRYFYYGNAEFIIPLNGFIRVFPFSNLEAIGGFDAGGVASSRGTLFDKRVLDGVLGVNLALGALIFRLHFARPIDIGAPLPANEWVTNFSIRLAGFDFGNALRVHPGLDNATAVSSSLTR
jgi:hypothetical protein